MYAHLTLTKHDAERLDLKRLPTAGYALFTPSMTIIMTAEAFERLATEFTRARLELEESATRSTPE